MFESIQFAALIGIWFLCPILIALILLQGGGDMGSAFGGGGQLDSSLGVGAVRKISKITGWLSLLFMVCVILVAIRSGGQSAEDLKNRLGSDSTVDETVIDESQVGLEEDPASDAGAGVDAAADPELAPEVPVEAAPAESPEPAAEAAPDAKPAVAPEVVPDAKPEVAPEEAAADAKPVLEAVEE